MIKGLTDWLDFPNLNKKANPKAGFFKE